MMFELHSDNVEKLLELFKDKLSPQEYEAAKKIARDIDYEIGILRTQMKPVAHKIWGIGLKEIVPIYDAPVNFSVTGTYGCVPKGEDDVYTVEEFRDCCDSKAFVDYDGWGYPVKEKKAARNVKIQPSVVECIPEDATHIVWYNR